MRSLLVVSALSLSVPALAAPCVSLAPEEIPVSQFVSQDFVDFYDLDVAPYEAVSTFHYLRCDDALIRTEQASGPGLDVEHLELVGGFSRDGYDFLFYAHLVDLAGDHDVVRYGYLALEDDRIVVNQEWEFFGWDPGFTAWELFSFITDPSGLRRDWELLFSYVETVEPSPARRT